MTGYVGDVAALARKDVLLELRSRDTLPALLLFVVSALVVFNFSLPAGSSRLAAYGLLWVAIVFTALLGLARAFAAEREQRLLDGLVLAPCDRSAIWLGKGISVFCLLVIAEAVALPAFALFFAPVDATLIAAVLLADVGLAAVGTLLAAMAAASRARELLLPLLFLPLVIPLVVGGVGATVASDPARYLGFLVTGIALAFYWVPNAPVEEFRQRIFYLHVPVALTAYACFIVGAWKGLRLLWTREQRYDLESYTAVHMGVIFGVLTLATGSIWAKTSWGVWWTWSERQLVLFLVLFLFYSAYFMLRFSVEPGPRRANLSAVYSLFGVVLIPVSFLAIRLAENLIHPVVFTRDVDENLAGSQLLTFFVCLAGTFALAASLYVNELTGKRLDERLRDLREALS